MCRQCDIKRITAEPIRLSEEEQVCEGFDGDPGEDEEPRMCSDPAEFLVRDYCVESHLCEDHMQKKAKDLEEGLGDLLREAGLVRATDFAPTTDPENCEYVAPLEMLEAGAKECGNPASYAELVLEEVLLCRRHALEWGYTPP